MEIIGSFAQSITIFVEDLIDWCKLSWFVYCVCHPDYTYISLWTNNRPGKTRTFLLLENKSMYKKTYSSLFISSASWNQLNQWKLYYGIADEYIGGVVKLFIFWHCPTEIDKNVWHALQKLTKPFFHLDTAEILTPSPSILFVGIQS